MPDPVHNDASLRWRWLLPVIGLVALFNLTPFDTALNRAFFDWASRHPARSPDIPASSVLVLIDDQTMESLRVQDVRWPFPRVVFAQLFAALRQAGAEKIVGDFTFFEESDSTHDLLLAGVTANTPNLLLARSRDSSTGRILSTVFWPEELRHQHPALFAKQPREGFVDFHADSDGVARRYPGEQTLAEAAFGARLPQRGDWLRWAGGLDQLGSRGVPVLSATQFIHAGQPIIQRVADAAPDLELDAIGRALQAEAPLTGALADQVRGKIVFVGANASGTFDIKATPVGQVEPGLLIHWTAWTNFVENSFISQASWPVVYGLAALVGIGVLIAGVNRSSIAPPLAAALTATIVVLVSAWVALSFGWFLPPATTLATVLFVLLGVVMENFWREQRRKREIQGMFGAYVDPAVVERLVRDPVSIRLGGERREATVFFSDLAGFTDLSEKLKEHPERMVEIVNAYLEETSECLHRHGAYVDKYIGDAVMAVLGAPSPLPNHALSACLAALEAREAMVGINQRYAADLGLKLEVRIGLNTGEMIVGNLGSSRKKNYTVMGDAVNLGSRLEGANKAFGTGILVGEETARRVQGAVLTRPLARLKVKGKKEAIEVHTLHGEPAKLSAEEKEFVASYRAGYTAYVDRRFAEALPALTRALALRPDDLTTRRLQSEAAAFASSPPPPTWEPVLSLDSK